MVGHHLRAGGHGGKDAARERGPALAARVRMHIRRSHARRCKQFWHRPRRRLQRQEDTSAWRNSARAGPSQ